MSVYKIPHKMCPNSIKPPPKRPLASISNLENLPKLYVGNLPKQTSRHLLRKLFNDFEISHTNISLHKSFAFVNVSDKPSLVKAIETLNGYNLNGSNLIMELAGKKNNRKRVSSTFIKKSSVEKPCKKESNNSIVVPVKKSYYPSCSNIQVLLGKKKASKDFCHNPSDSSEPVAEYSNSLQSPVKRSN